MSRLPDPESPPAPSTKFEPPPFGAAMLEARRPPPAAANDEALYRLLRVIAIVVGVTAVRMWFAFH